MYFNTSINPSKGTLSVYVWPSLSLSQCVRLSKESGSVFIVVFWSLFSQGKAPCLMSQFEGQKMCSASNLAALRFTVFTQME